MAIVLSFPVTVAIGTDTSTPSIRNSPPEIREVRIGPQPVPNDGITYLTIEANVVDPDFPQPNAIDQVRINLESMGLGNRSMKDTGDAGDSAAGDGWWTHQVAIPKDVSPGTYTVGIYAEDLQQYPDTGLAMEYRDVEVAMYNRAPRVLDTAPAVWDIQEDTPAELDMTTVFDDLDGDELQFFIKIGKKLTDHQYTGLLNLDMDGADGQLSAYPLANQSGTQPVVVVAQEKGTGDIYQTIHAFNISVANIPDAPVILSNGLPDGGLVANEGEKVSFQVMAVDGDGDRLTFTDGSDIFDIDPDSGWVNFTVTWEHLGNHSESITVEDGTSGGSADIQVEMDLRNVADSPVIVSIDDQTVEGLSQKIIQVSEDTPTQVVVEAFDADVAAGLQSGLYFTTNVSGLELSGDIDSNPATFIFDPSAVSQDQSVGYVTVMEDPNGVSGRMDSFRIVIQCQRDQDPPQIEKLVEKDGRDRVESLTVEFVATARDADPNDVLKYCWDFGHDNSSTESFDTAIQHTFPEPGNYTITLVVEDLDGLSDTATMRLFVDPDLTKPDVDGDGLDDEWELSHFHNWAQGPAGDYDGDGFTNFQEQEKGTDPKDPDDYPGSSQDGDGSSDLWKNIKEHPGGVLLSIVVITILLITLGLMYMYMKRIRDEENRELDEMDRELDRAEEMARQERLMSQSVKPIQMRPAVRGQSLRSKPLQESKGPNRPPKK